MPRTRVSLNFKVHQLGWLKTKKIIYFGVALDRTLPHRHCRYSYELSTGFLRLALLRRVSTLRSARLQNGTWSTQRVCQQSMISNPRSEPEPDLWVCPRASWYKPNRLRSVVGRFRLSLPEWGLATFSNLCVWCH